MSNPFLTGETCPDCGHKWDGHYPDCHKPCDDRIKQLKEVISDLHSVVEKEGWDILEPETQEIALAIHEELWHGEEG